MPRRRAGLWRELTSRRHLLLAYRRARKAGRSRAATTAFDYHLEGELDTLRDELRDGTYRPGTYRSFEVHEPKRRLVSAAPFRDRVVHHALVGMLEPVFEPRFVHDSYACRRSKGTHTAVDRAAHFTKRFPYCLGGDILRFFASVDHEVLLAALARKLRCGQTLDLAGRILAGGAHVLREQAPQVLFPGDDLLALTRPRGIPIGNLTSQFFGNVVLDPLDHFVKEELRVKGYVRYADDFRLYADSKRALWDWLDRIEKRLAGLRLSLHPRKTWVGPCSTGVPFLGFVLYADGRRRVQRAGALRYRKRLRRNIRAYVRGEMTPEAAGASLRSWLAHADHAHAAGLRRQILKEMRERCEQKRPLCSSGRTTSSAGSCPTVQSFLDRGDTH
jgi:retron-type reverse transcriptase